MTEKRIRLRTDRQNRALHKWFEMVSKELNASGKSVKVVLEKKLDVDWHGDLFKELVWRPAQIAVLGKHSTKLLRKQEDIDRVYDTLNRFLGENFGVHVPWPHFEGKDAYELETSRTEN